MPFGACGLATVIKPLSKKVKKGLKMSEVSDRL